MELLVRPRRSQLWAAVGFLGQFDQQSREQGVLLSRRDSSYARTIPFASNNA